MDGVVKTIALAWTMACLSMVGMVIAAEWGAEKMNRDELCLIVMLIAIDLYIKLVVKDIFRR